MPCVHVRCNLPCSTPLSEVESFLVEQLATLSARDGTVPSLEQLMYASALKMMRQGVGLTCDRKRSRGQQEPNGVKVDDDATVKVDATEVTSKPKRVKLDDLATVTVAATEVGDDTSGCVVLEPQDESVTSIDFPPVTLDREGYPLQMFAAPSLHSPYAALHARDSSAFPLSQRVFSNRAQLFEFGQQIGCTPWKYERVRAAWTAQEDGVTRLCALLINERYEPRWGTLFCTDGSARKRDVEWQADLVTRPIPVFLVSLWGNDIRYCGHWNFERLTPLDSARTFEYVLGQRARHGVHRVALAHYDDAWGVAA